MQIVLFILIFILFVGGIIYFGMKAARAQMEKLRNNFRLFAEQLGCQALIPQGRWGSPSINGTYRNHPIHIWMFTRTTGSGKNQSTTTYTAMSITCRNPQGFQLNLWEEGFFSKIGKIFGMQDIKTNDEEFDRAFVLKSNNESLARILLVPALRSQLVELSKGRVGFSFMLKEEQIYYEEAIALYKPENMQWFRRVLDVLCHIADGVEMASDVTR
jgi:hypothetical protein